MLSDMTDEQLEAIVNLTESRILSISKDDLRLHEDQLMWSQALWNEVRDYWTSLNHAWKVKKLPKCTCLDHDGGWLGKRTKKGKIYGDYIYNEIPCNIEWAKQHKELLKGWTYERN